MNALIVRNDWDSEKSKVQRDYSGPDRPQISGVYEDYELNDTVTCIKNDGYRLFYGSMLAQRQID